MKKALKNIFAITVAGLLPLLGLSQVATKPKVVLNRDASITVTLAGDAPKSYKVVPKFIVMSRQDNPQLQYVFEKEYNKEGGRIRLASWKKPSDTSVIVTDYFDAATSAIVTATKAKLLGDKIVWTFPQNRQYELEAWLNLPGKLDQPVIEYSIKPKQAGYYSVGFAGMPAINSSAIEGVWQPWIWQEKRFPKECYLSIEEMCGLPATMVQQSGVTYGVVADPTTIPFRLPVLQLDKINFGVMVRNRAGEAQPMIFAPVLGTGESKLAANQAYSSKFRLLFYPGKQIDAFRFVARNIYNFKDYRRNVFNNLNQTLENFVDYAMNDLYSGWNAELKGFDYSTDVDQTIKVVTAIHPLSVAFITDNEGIYHRRALPLIEFNLSREKYLYSVAKDHSVKVQGQFASGKMTGPGVEVGELAAMDNYTLKRNPILSYFADSLKNTTRFLNLKMVSRGDTWSNLLSLYRMTGDKSVLQAAMAKADAYIDARINRPQTDFEDAQLSGSGQFWSEFAPQWVELLDLYEQTGEKRYLEASAKGADLYAQFCWFTPVIPDSNILVNPGGIVPYKGHHGERKANMPFMRSAEQYVPAWRLSQIGLTPEACLTFADNPAIFLAQYAAPLLRLGYYTNDDFFKSIARSAIIGRYSNYPGYDINGIFNTVYEKPDYPLRDFNEIAYNQVYYNHVWPHIALLYDFLVSDVFTHSAGNISFPHQYSPGYAYLKGNVYGVATGKFYNESNVNLWLPKQALQTGHEQLDYLLGYGNGKVYLALVNQCDSAVTTEVSLNPNIIPFEAGKHYTFDQWQQNTKTGSGSMLNGKLRVTIAPRGITAVAIKGIHVVTQFQQKVLVKNNKTPDRAYRLIESPVGKITATRLSFGKGLTNAFIWFEATPETLKGTKVSYKRTHDKEWLTLTDNDFPFEYSISLKEADTNIELKLTAQKNDGSQYQSETFILTGENY